MNSVKGKVFMNESINRKLVLSFSNDSTCTFKNIFNCEDIDDEYKNISINATYKRDFNTIIVTNKLCKTDDCVLAPKIEIPIQKSKKCDFLNEDYRKDKIIFDGRHIKSKFHEYGIIPNIDIDTIYIYKNKIILLKVIDNVNRGFIFKGISKNSKKG
jgi:hypothetical protein